MLRAIKLPADDVPIDLVLHTPGGLVLASEQIANSLCRRPGKVTVFVPRCAMSGGILLASASDEIVMDEDAVLGPLDPHLNDMPAASILKVLEQKDANEIDNETPILADLAGKGVHQIHRTVQGMLTMRGAPLTDAKSLSDALASGEWTHDYPISVEEAQELDLQVGTDMPEEIYELMNLFPQTRQRRPCVQFIPMPYTEHPMRRTSLPADRG